MNSIHREHQLLSWFTYHLESSMSDLCTPPYTGSQYLRCSNKNLKSRRVPERKG